MARISFIRRTRIWQEIDPLVRTIPYMSSVHVMQLGILPS